MLQIFKTHILDGKSCSWKTICNHNKGSGWPEEMLTVAEFLTLISVYIKHVCAVLLFYIQIDTESIPGSLWSRLSTKGCWLWHGWEWLENTQDPTLRRESDYHEPTVLIPTHIFSYLTPAPAAIKQPCSTPSCPRRALGSRNGGIDSSEAASAAHICVSCPSINPTCCLLLKAQLQLIQQCSFLIYTCLERGFGRLCKSYGSSSSLLVPFLAQGWSLEV